MAHETRHSKGRTGGGRKRHEEEGEQDAGDELPPPFSARCVVAIRMRRSRSTLRFRRQSLSLALAPEMTEEEFRKYAEKISEVRPRNIFHGSYLCPCCQMPTIDEIGGFEICPICNWEDDGQDSDDADSVWPGPNHGYSLTEARKNFREYWTMYDPGDVDRFERVRPKLKRSKELYYRFSKAMSTESEDDWREALEFLNATEMKS